jgi:hypothetical protein
MPISLLALFCKIDDFCLLALPEMRKSQIDEGKPTRNRKRNLSESEIITLLVAFHLWRFRDFKTFYIRYVQVHWKAEFPGLVSYQRFIEYIPSVLVLLFHYLASLRGSCSGISFIDSTKMTVCHNARIRQNKVFEGIAQRGKTSTGWFFGFKLHLVFNDEGEILNFRLTRGNVDDRKPVKDLLCKMFGKVFGDKGYIGQELFDALFAEGVELITKSRKGMKPRLMRYFDRLLLRRRAIIESIIDQLKNVCQIEHSRHRAPSGFLWNLMAALIAYCHLPKKPSLNLRETSAIAIA